MDSIGLPEPIRPTAGRTSPEPADATGSITAPCPDPRHRGLTEAATQCGGATITFTVPGIPTPWARAAGGATRARFTPAKQRSAAGAIKHLCSLAMRGARPLEGAVSLWVLAVYPWPTSWSGKKRAANQRKTSRPDVDNIGKLLADALNGVAWIDDAQIAVVRLAKVYGDHPGLQVKIEALT
jgi:Holliday junction resolvase RusA-like endonuclease